MIYIGWQPRLTGRRRSSDGEQWFVFRYDDVAALFADPRLSADRMKGFVDAAPPEVCDDLRRIAP